MGASISAAKDATPSLNKVDEQSHPQGVYAFLLLSLPSP
jgi:hypothetical protein